MEYSINKILQSAIQGMLQSDMNKVIVLDLGDMPMQVRNLIEHSVGVVTKGRIILTQQNLSEGETC